jgi:hypothetical protein
MFSLGWKLLTKKRQAKLKRMGLLQWLGFTIVGNTPLQDGLLVRGAGAWATIRYNEAARHVTQFAYSLPWSGCWLLHDAVTKKHNLRGR